MKFVRLLTHQTIDHVGLLPRLTIDTPHQTTFGRLFTHQTIFVELFSAVDTSDYRHVPGHLGAVHSSSCHMYESGSLLTSYATLCLKMTWDGDVGMAEFLAVGEGCEAIFWPSSLRD